MQTEIQTYTLAAPVSLVTLLEDRAQVRRMGQINLTSGLWRVRVEAVAPVLSDKSLRAEFCQAAPGARIDDVRVRRQMLVKAAERPEAIQALLDEWRSLYTQFSYTHDDRGYLERSFREVELILSHALQELPIDAAWGQIDPTSWREQLQTLFKQLREIRTAIHDRYQVQERLGRQINHLVDHIQAVLRPDTFYSAFLEADLMITQGGDYEIAFEYVVPNALWRPWHQALLTPSVPGTEAQTGSLQFRMDGCVWQRTGEDWTDVDLIFSTARTSLGTEPPLLTDDLLSVQEKSKQIHVQTRNQTVQTTGYGAGTPPDTIELPGVEDGGEVRTLRSLHKATIPSDGRPYRVPLFRFEAPAQVEYVLMPELAAQVMLKSEQTNTAAFPILAGPVDLVRSTEFVGKTLIPFIAPGEKFALGWGPDPALRVQRTQRQKRDQDHLTRWNHVTTTTKVFLSNIGADPRTLKVTERLPLSELEQVKVEVIAAKTTDRVQPDSNGFCTWTVTLPPYSQHSISLVSKLSATPEVQGL